MSWCDAGRRDSLLNCIINIYFGVVCSGKDETHQLSVGIRKRGKCMRLLPLLTVSHVRDALSFLTPVNMHSHTCTLLKMIDNSERNTAGVVKEHQLCYGFMSQGNVWKNIFHIHITCKSSLSHTLCKITYNM